MNYDPFLKTGAQVIFYVAVIALIVMFVAKKRKQLNSMHDEIKDDIKSKIERDEDDLRHK